MVVREGRGLEQLKVTSEGPASVLGREGSAYMGPTAGEYTHTVHIRPVK